MDASALVRAAIRDIRSGYPEGQEERDDDRHENENQL
jgi:hypothetical protein